MSSNQCVHQKYTCMYKENYTKWKDTDFFKESETYMYLGEERWVMSSPDWVLFMHHCLTRKMHKIIYMSMLSNQWVHQKDTSVYKENYTTWRDNDFFQRK